MTETGFYSLILALSISLYFLTNRLNPLYNWETRFDQKISLYPAFIAPYLFFFPFFGLTALTFYFQPDNSFKEFVLANSIALVLAAIFWFWLPNGVKRPKEQPKGVFGWALTWVWWLDSQDTNGCPSSHVFVSLISSYYLATLLPQYWILIYLTGGLIAVSTLFTKQHYLPDVLGGIILSIISISLTNFLFI